MIGSIIVMIIGLWAFSLVCGILIAHYSWSPPGQLKIKRSE